MRRPRIQRPGQDTHYHCMSRAVAAERLFGHRERRAFCHRVRKTADFCQIRIRTHICMSNHFHVFFLVPAQVKLSDKQMFRTLRAFYGPQHEKTVAFAKALAENNQTMLQHLRAGYLARMGKLSNFLKELKQGFSKWYNALHERIGTLWAERFKSVILPQGMETLRSVAAYIDLNSVRAGLVNRPEDYAWCGYAEALARNGPERQQLCEILPGKKLDDKLANYRQFLYAQGAVSKKAGQAVIDPKEAWKVYKEGGKLTLPQALTLKVKYFSDAIAMGPEEFVNEIFEKHYQKGCKQRRCPGWSMTGADWKGLMSLKKIKEPIQLPNQD